MKYVSLHFYNGGGFDLLYTQKCSMKKVEDTFLELKLPKIGYFLY